jgi:hypothetical protein
MGRKLSPFDILEIQTLLDSDITPYKISRRLGFRIETVRYYKPGVREKVLSYMKGYRENPKVKKREKRYQRKYMKNYMREYSKRPEVRRQRISYWRKRRLNKK